MRASASTLHDQDRLEKAAFSLPREASCVTARADAFSLLIDADSYFRALASAIRQARHSIWILGWDFSPNLILERRLTGGASNGPPLMRLLIDKARANPGLDIRILIWDAPLVMEEPRGAWNDPALPGNWPPNLKVKLDGHVPLLGCHHEKLVAIDGNLVFLGGIDLAQGRWDRIDHPVSDPRRRDRETGGYGPRHDLQCCLTGPIARAITQHMASRWLNAYDAESHAAVEATDGAAPPGALWPEGLARHFQEVDIAFSRTRGRYRGRDAVLEIEAQHIALIEQAERLIYIENQYLTSRSVARALIAALRRSPALRVLVIGPRQPRGFIEKLTMRAGRRAFWDALCRAGMRERVRVTYPCLQHADRHLQPIHVHSKLMVVDDRHLTIGSANISNRSMSLDSECMITLTARTGEQRQSIAALRNRLLSEHSGLELAVVESLLRTDPFAILNTAGSRPRLLAELPAASLRTSIGSKLLHRIMDPDRSPRRGQPLS